VATRAAEHWIGSVTFDIAAPGRAALDPVRAMARDRFDGAILPLLQAALDRVDDPAAALRFGRIDVDLGRLGPAAGAPEEILRRIGAALAKALDRARHAGAGETRAGARGAVGARGGRGDSDAAGDAGGGDAAIALAAFLESGVLPWAAPGRALAALAAAALALEASGMARLAQHLRPLLADRRAAERLVQQLPAALVRRLIEALAPGAPAETIDAAFGPAGAMPGTAPVDARRAPALAEAIRRFARGDGGDGSEVPARSGAPDAVRPEAVRTDGAAPSPDAPRAPPADRKAAAGSEVDQADDAMLLPVEAAGAVLLHPFLATLFDRVGLLASPGRFRDPDARIRAVLLTHHLATGAEEAAEPEMLLAKLLCGLDFAEPVPLRIDPTPDERAQCDALLTSVIAQWTKLGRTSPAGLREAFLTRPGRLDRRREPWRLTVERHAIDLLLDALPWPLSLVKTPFMPALLQVDWR
jgi:hypothetical protein